MKTQRPACATATASRPLWPGGWRALRCVRAMRCRRATWWRASPPPCRPCSTSAACASSRPASRPPRPMCSAPPCASSAPGWRRRRPATTCGAANSWRSRALWPPRGSTPIAWRCRRQKKTPTPRCRNSRWPAPIWPRPARRWMWCSALAARRRARPLRCWPPWPAACCGWPRPARAWWRWAPCWSRWATPRSSKWWRRCCPPMRCRCAPAAPCASSAGVGRACCRGACAAWSRRRSPRCRRWAWKSSGSTC